MGFLQLINTQGALKLGHQEAQVKVPALNPEPKSEEEAGGKDDGKPSDGVHLRELQGLLYEIEDVGFRVCRG